MHFQKNLGLFPICNNPLFKIGNNTVKSNFFANKNFQVAFLLIENGCTYLDRISFNIQHNLNIRETAYENLIKSIRDGATKIGISLENAETQCRPRQSILGHVATSQLKGCRPFYRIFRLKKDEKMYQTVGDREIKWHADLGTILSINFWQKCKLLVSEIKHHNDIAWLQLQILRNSLKTNYIVSKFVPLVNEKCSFNCNEVETSLHLFHGCVHTSSFLNDVNTWRQGVNPRYCIKTDRLSILFGLHNEDANSEKNVITLVAKKCIWIQKFRTLTPNLDRFKLYLFDFLNNLECIHKIKNDNDNFAESWSCLLQDLETLLHDGNDAVGGSIQDLDLPAVRTASQQGLLQDM